MGARGALSILTTLTVAAGAWLACGAVSAPANVARADASRPVYCQYPSNYYPSLCSGKQKATNSCAETISQNLEFPEYRPRAEYLPGSTSRYRVKVFEQSVTGCHYVGHRVISIVQERRDGSVGTFAPSSTPIVVRANGAYRLTTILMAPYTCTTASAGSAVRLDVRVTWVPDHGFGKVPARGAPPLREPLKWDAFSREQSIC
jgi:hypothetical protein